MKKKVAIRGQEGFPIERRAGVHSKFRPCHWCGRQRWTGWWVKVIGGTRYRPACSGHAGQMFDKGHDVIQRET